MYVKTGLISMPNPTFKVSAMAALAVVVFACGRMPEKAADNPFIAKAHGLTEDSNGPTFTTIDVPGATATVARDISPTGDAIVGTRQDAVRQSHGFELRNGVYTTIDFPSDIATKVTLTETNAIVREDDVVGAYRSANKFHGYRLREDEFTKIDFPGATDTAPYGINSGGDITGVYCDGSLPCGGSGNRGFLLSEGQFTLIDFPGAIRTSTIKINRSGDIAGFYEDAQGLLHGFLLEGLGEEQRRHSGGMFTTFDFPGAISTRAVGLNARGDIVGSYCNAPPCGASLVGWHAFLLSDGKFTPTDFPGAHWIRAVGISARGDIAGNYLDFGGKMHAFLISETPENPSGGSSQVEVRNEDLIDVTAEDVDLGTIL